MHLPLFAVAAFLAATQGPATPESADNVAPLTLDRALALADQYHPLLAAAAAQTDAARGAILTAEAHPNPDVNFISGHQTELQPSAVPGRLDHYGVAQRIELPSVRRSRIRTATLLHESSEWNQTNARLMVRAQVKQAFYEAIRRKQELELAHENLRIVEDFRRRIQVQVNVGEAARLELTRADAELATTRAQVRTAELRLSTAMAALRGVVSAPLDNTVAVDGRFDDRPLDTTLEGLRSEVLARNPELKQAQLEIGAAGALLETEKNLRKPQPTWILEVEKMPDLAFVRSGISLSLPFWDRRKGQIQEASARVRQANAGLAAKKLELNTAIETAYGEYEASTQLIDSYQSGALREAEAALNAAEAAFRFGERGIIEVLDAQRLLRSVRLDYLDAQFRRQSALIEIERLRSIN